MAQGRVDLLDHKRMKNELRGLERLTRSGSKDSVDHYQAGHDDLSNAVAGAVYLAGVRETITPQVFVLGGLEEEDSWEQRLILENQRAAEARDMEPDPPEITALCNEEFAVQFLIAMKKHGLLTKVASVLGVDEPLLRRWFGLKKS